MWFVITFECQCCGFTGKPMYGYFFTDDELAAIEEGVLKNSSIGEVKERCGLRPVRAAKCPRCQCVVGTVITT